MEWASASSSKTPEGSSSTGRAWRTISITAGIVVATSCGGVKNFLALEEKQSKASPISSPFGAYQTGGDRDPSQPVVLRSSQGDRSFEVALPRNTENTDLVIPTSPGSPSFRSDRRNASSYGDPPVYTDESYLEKKPTFSDREIASSLPQVAPEDAFARKEVEDSLGLRPTDDPTPIRDKSYLAGIDHIKQLFKINRHESALLEVDDMLRAYPTDPKLHAMRGTLLDRIGRAELAIKSWKQSLKLDPGNLPLRKFVERRDARLRNYNASVRGMPNSTRLPGDVTDGLQRAPADNRVEPPVSVSAPVNQVETPSTAAAQTPATPPPNVAPPVPVPNPDTIVSVPLNAAPRSESAATSAPTPLEQPAPAPPPQTSVTAEQPVEPATPDSAQAPVADPSTSAIERAPAAVTPPVTTPSPNGGGAQ